MSIGNLFPWFRGKKEETKPIKKPEEKPKSAIPKSAIPANQTIYRDRFNGILPETKTKPDTSEIQEEPKNVEKVIEFSPELLAKYGLPQYIEGEEKKEFNAKDPRTCARKHLRAGTNEFIDDQIEVKTFNPDTEEFGLSILSNISAGGLQIMSTQAKKIGDELVVEFHIHKDFFSLKGVVRNILNGPGEFKKYGLQFIDPPKELIALIQLMIGSAKL